MADILIVEDDTESRYMLEQLLLAKNHQVRAAQHGKEALKLARKSPPELIISDIMMPVMDGFKLCREAKEDSSLQSIPFIFYTATFTEVEDERLALGLGATRFLIKPKTGQELLDVFEEVLETQRKGELEVHRKPLLDNDALSELYETSISRKLEETVDKLQKERRALQESEKKLKEAQEIAQIGHWELEIETGTTHWSDELYRILGWKPKEIEGSYEALTEAIHPDDRDIVDKAYSDSLKKRTAYNIDHRLLLGDGSLKYVHQRCQSQIDDDGELIYLMGTVHDITERKLIEEELRQYREQLEELVSVRTEALEKANWNLKEAKHIADQANLAKTVYLAQMSHDLRTPLNSIIGLTEMMVEDTEAENLLDIQETLSRLTGAEEQMLALLNDILDLSKIEAGKMTLNEEPIVLSGIADNALSTAQSLAQANNNKLTMRCSDSLENIYVDPIRLQQILLNLLGNACKFTKDGEVCLAMESTQTKGQDRVLFSITDTGIGMDQESLESLFQEYGQIGPTLDAKNKGTGLGLSISRKIARLMGGNITVKSELGVGSTFTVNLPLRRLT